MDNAIVSLLSSVLVMNDGADRLPFMHQIEGFIDTRERPRMRDERRELDLARHRVFDHARQLRAALDAAECRAQPAAAGDELERAGGDFLTRAGHADNNRLAPAAMRAFERRTHHVDVADAF